MSSSVPWESALILVISLIHERRGRQPDLSLRDFYSTGTLQFILHLTGSSTRAPEAGVRATLQRLRDRGILLFLHRDGAYRLTDEARRALADGAVAKNAAQMRQQMEAGTTADTVLD